MEEMNRRQFLRTIRRKSLDELAGTLKSPNQSAIKNSNANYSQGNPDKKVSRRRFLKTAGIALAGVGASLAFPYKVLAATKSKEDKKSITTKLLKRALEPYTDNLTKSVISVESNWNPEAYNKGTKATGLMQIVPVTLEDFNKHGTGKLYNKFDLYDPYVNVQIGKWHLYDRIKKQFLPRYGLKDSTSNMLTAWNWGIGHLRKLGDADKHFRRLPRQTQRFIKKVKSKL